LNDYEDGGVALNDPSAGLDYQAWELTYNEITGDFTLTPETIGPPVVGVHNAMNVTECALAFDQNCRPFIAYVEAGVARFWWYDSQLADHTVTDLPEGSTSPQCCLDDKRSTQTGTSDTILSFVYDGKLWASEQRDRFEVAYELLDGVTTRLLRVGMNNVLRLQWGLEI
jgi:hypothetical protein